MSIVFRTQLGLVCLVFCAACSGGRVTPGQIRKAQSAYDEGHEALASGDFSEALDQFDLAINNDGLNADQLADALVCRAECHIELGNYDDAQADLDEVSRGTPDGGKYHLVRCKLLLKQGDGAQAQVAFNEARKSDPSIEAPAGLK